MRVWWRRYELITLFILQCRLEGLFASFLFSTCAPKQRETDNVNVMNGWTVDLSPQRLLPFLHLQLERVVFKIYSYRIAPSTMYLHSKND